MTYTEAGQQSKSLTNLMSSLWLCFVRLWLRCVGPRWTVGVLVVLNDAHGRVCLLKHKGRTKPWGLPGGLIRWPERPQEGLRRELKEELGWAPPRETSFKLEQTLVSEKFQMLELVYSLNTPVDQEESSVWKLQATEIKDISWLTLKEVEALSGILERHRSMLVNVLRRS